MTPKRCKVIDPREELPIREALEAVLNEATGRFAREAKIYAQAALDRPEMVGFQSVEDDLTETGSVHVLRRPTGLPMQGDELRTQLWYVLSNLQGWRGDRARQVKAVLKAFASRKGASR